LKISPQDFVKNLSPENKKQLIKALKEKPIEEKNLKTNDELIEEFINSLKAKILKVCISYH